MLGVWMWPEGMRVRGTEAVFDACARAGVTDVFFLTKGLAGTAAFLSPLLPAMAPGRDLLREALDAAHGRGMRLHAWFTSASDERYRREHPEKGLFHYRDGRNRGIISISDGDYACFMQDVLGDMLRRYDVDGVHLDYIRYNHLAYGWSDEDKARYAAQGVDLKRVGELMERTFYADPPQGEAIFDAFRGGDADVLRLAEARRRDVKAFAGALASAVRGERPDATLSAALMPEGAYDDLAFADLHYGQHYADLAGLMDLFLPMAYSQAYGKDADWMRLVSRGTARHGVRTLVGVHAYEGGTGLTLSRDLEAVKGEGNVAGACLFREGSAVWAFASGKTLSLLNPLPETVTACRVTGREGCADVPVRVESGGWADCALPFAPQVVQAFAGEKELCALTVRE